MISVVTYHVCLQMNPAMPTFTLYLSHRNLILSNLLVNYLVRTA